MCLQNASCLTPATHCSRKRVPRRYKAAIDSDSSQDEMGGPGPRTFSSVRTHPTLGAASSTDAAAANRGRIDGAARDMVANDIFDSRYDRLLLPDRFDSEEVPRRAARESGVVYVDVGAGGVGAEGAGAEGAGAGGGGGAAGGGPLQPSAPPPGAAAAEEDEECPVCLGTSPISARLPCRHQFCRECIEDWARRSPGAGCPLCRAPFSVADIGAAIRA